MNIDLIINWMKRNPYQGNFQRIGDNKIIIYNDFDLEWLISSIDETLFSRNSLNRKQVLEKKNKIIYIFDDESVVVLNWISPKHEVHIVCGNSDLIQ